MVLDLWPYKVKGLVNVNIKDTDTKGMTVNSSQDILTSI